MTSSDSDAWQTGKTLLDSHKHMLENEVASDVKFIFPASESSGEVTIRAHKYILICRSPVFEVMLTDTRYSEASEGVRISDIEPGVFKCLLSYMYCDRIELTGDNVLQILYGAKKYFINGLVKRCNRFFKEEMNEENVCSVLNSALLLNEDVLAKMCLGYIARSARKVFEHKSFCQLSENALFEVLRCDGIGLPLEADVFDLCLKWAKYQQQFKEGTPIRKVLDKCLPQIRLSKMTAQELARVIAKAPEMFSFEEQATYFRHIADPKSGILKSKQKSRTLNQLTLNRFPSAKNGKNQPFRGDTGEDTFSFRVDKTVSLRGVSVYGDSGNTVEYFFAVKLLYEKELIHAHYEYISSNGSDQPIEIRFSEYMTLLPGNMYMVEITSSPRNTSRFYGVSTRTTIVVDGVTFAFESSVGKKVLRDRVPQLFFNKVE